MKSIELRRDRAKLIHDARKLVETAEAEKRDLNGEEESQWGRMNEEIDSLGSRVKRLESLEKSEAEDDDEDEEKPDDESKDDDKEENDDDEDGESNSRMFSRSKGKGEGRAMLYDEKRGARKIKVSGSYARNWRRYAFAHANSPEYRDAILSTDSQGGFAALPVELVDGYIVALNNLVFMRNLATVRPCTDAKALGVRQMTVQPSDAAFTSEIAQVTADTAMTLNRYDLTPQLVSKLVTESVRLQLAAPDFEKQIMDRIQYKVAIASENGYLNGTGNANGQPCGIFYNSTGDQIGSGQDLTASVSLSKLFTGDDFVSTVYNIPQQYLSDPSCGWIMHRSMVGKVRTLKDNFGQYLWVAGLQQNRPDQFCGFPVYMSEYAPALQSNGTGTASQYVACFGAYSWYYIAEVVPPIITVLRERYRDLHEIGYLIEYFTDGAAQQPLAFTRLKLAAS